LRSSAPEGGLDGDDFLLKAEAVITFNLGTDLGNRALELSNKMNQFNLNGKRFSESEWLNFLHGL